MGPISRAHGKDAYFAVDDSGGTLRNISAHVDSVSGLPSARALSDVTSFTDTGERFIPGLQGASFTVSGQFGLGRNVSVAPTLSYAHNAQGSNDTSVSEMVGYALTWRATRSLEIQSSLTHALVLDPQRRALTRTSVFGSGARLRFPAAALLRPLIDAGIGIETMDTAAACRTYNVLLAEGRKVVAALLFVARAEASR